MSLLSNSHVEVIETFFADDAPTRQRAADQRTAQCAADQRTAQRAADQRTAQRAADQRTAVEVALVGERLTIARLPTLEVLGGWLPASVDPSVDALGILLPIGRHGHLGAIVDRAGSATWFSIERGVLCFDRAASCQLLDDLARSRLHLPTAPPATGTDWYWLGCWLLGVQQAVSATEHHRGGRNLDAVSVAGWHPAIDPDDLFGLDFELVTSFVIDRHRDHAVVADWECVRLDAGVDAQHPFHHLASVLDAGAFSRWVAACGEPLSGLAGPLMVGCSPLALRLIGAVIADVVLRQRVG